MTDLEINRRLALAIGWKASDGRIVDGIVEVRWGTEWMLSKGYFVWNEFDYRSADVIWPIAKRYNMFPQMIGESWIVWNGEKSLIADSPEKAVALAVIESQKK